MTLVKFKHHRTEGNFNNFMENIFAPFPSIVKNGFDVPTFKQIAPVNITETETGYDLEIVAPGFAKEDFKIDVTKNTLTISAEKKSEEENKQEKQIRREYRYQSFTRSFTIEDTMDPDAISAQYVNGVLALNLPKRQPVKVPVKNIAVS